MTINFQGPQYLNRSIVPIQSQFASKSNSQHVSFGYGTGYDDLPSEHISGNSKGSSRKSEEVESGYKPKKADVKGYGFWKSIQIMLSGAGHPPYDDFPSER